MIPTLTSLLFDFDLLYSQRQKLARLPYRFIIEIQIFECEAVNTDAEYHQNMARFDVGLEEK